MSEQEEETPAWHAIVGEGWEPVRFGDETKADDEVLRSQGWVSFHGDGGFTYKSNMMPRRRRKRSFDVLAMKGAVIRCHINAAKPGDCFRLTENGELIKIEVGE